MTIMYTACSCINFHIIFWTLRDMGLEQFGTFVNRPHTRDRILKGILAAIHRER